MQCRPLHRLPASLVLSVLLLVSATAAADSAHGLTGVSMWMGQYSYVSTTQSPVPFTLSLRTAADGSFTGMTTEPATFGNGSARALTADVRGSISGDDVYFNKTYDSSGGQTHTVQYTGRLAADGRSLSGTWHSGTINGNFSASLVSLTH